MLVVVSSVMSSRIECQTEQYFSRDNCDGAIELRRVDVAADGKMNLHGRRRGEGRCSARCADSETVSDLSGWRPRVRMSATSVAMHPASAAPSSCTGDSP